MPQLDWKRIDYDNKDYEIVAKDLRFVYRLKEREGHGDTSTSRYSSGRGFRYKQLQLAIRKLDDLEWKLALFPHVIIDLSPGPSITDEDVLRKYSCLENQIWINRPDEMYEAIERWLDDYGYLKTLKKFNKEE